MAILGTRVESFPFDSTDSGYDEDGYPVYDRAVGASLLRTVFARFFKDGVFDTPSDALQIAKGSTGLTVTINPGIFIINGAMGGIPSDVQPMRLTIDTGTVQGNTCYGIMLRYDENQDARTLSIRPVKGEPGASPVPPAPETNTPGVMEYRLGYVTVPSGSTTMANATVTNEKGLTVCPFATAFVEIDVSSVVSDFRNSAQALLYDFSDELGEYQVNAAQLVEQMVQKLNQYQGLLDAALDETTAGHLQKQITELQQQLQSVDLANSVDNETVEYTTALGGTSPKLRVKDKGIGYGHLAMGVDVDGGLASARSVFGVTSDLARIAYEFDRDKLNQMDDLDSIVVYDFPDDVEDYEGQYDSGSNRYYANQGA